LSVVTKGGDKGRTSLLGGKRVPKDDPRVECYGTVDELNALVGLALSLARDALFAEELTAVQNDLHLLSSRIALDPGAGDEIKACVPAFGEERLKRVEALIERVEPTLPRLTRFILYGGTEFAASLQVLRAVARRAERALVRFSGTGEVDEIWLAYLNRLSDLFFILSRAANMRAGAAERFWEK